MLKKWKHKCFLKVVFKSHDSPLSSGRSSLLRFAIWATAAHGSPRCTEYITFSYTNSWCKFCLWSLPSNSLHWKQLLRHTMPSFLWKETEHGDSKAQVTVWAPDDGERGVITPTPTCSGTSTYTLCRLVYYAVIDCKVTGGKLTHSSPWLQFIKHIKCMMEIVCRHAWCETCCIYKHRYYTGEEQLLQPACYCVYLQANSRAAAHDYTVLIWASSPQSYRLGCAWTGLLACWGTCTVWKRPPERLWSPNLAVGGCRSW